MKRRRKYLLCNLSFPVQVLLHSKTSSNQCCYLMAIKLQNQLLLFLWSQALLQKFLLQNSFANQKHNSEGYSHPPQLPCSLCPFPNPFKSGLQVLNVVFIKGSSGTPTVSTGPGISSDYPPLYSSDFIRVTTASMEQKCKYVKHNLSLMPLHACAQHFHRSGQARS